MANVKITELTALTTPVGTDVLPIVDVLGDVTKKVTVADLNSATSTTTTDGDIIIRSSGSETRLPIGSEGQALLVSSGLPVWGNVAGGYTDPLTTDGDIVIRSGGVSTRLGIGSEGQVLKVSSGLPVWAADAGGDVLLDTTPQLGGDLDVNGYDIVSASGGNVEIAPDTTGSFVIRGNNTDGSITLNCTANTHGVTIQSPPHASAATYTLILPDDTGTSGQVLSTNGTGTLSWLTATEPGDNISTLTNDSGFITSTVTGDFTVDTDTLYVDSANNRVGTGTSSPSTKLTIDHTTPIDTTNAAVAGQLGNVYLEMSSGGTQGDGNLGPSINFTGINQSGIDGRKAAIVAQQTGTNSSQVGLSFWTNNTADSGGVIQNRMVISSNGRVGINTVSPAKNLDVNGEIRASTGILFGTDTAAANTLDDYEEGTWTPGIEGGATAGSYTFSGTGAYTKVGNKVTVWGQLLDITTVSAGSGNLLITGLPFTSALGFPAMGSIVMDSWDLSGATYIDVVAMVSNAVNYMNPRIVRDGTTDISVGITAKSSNSADIQFCVTYTVA